MTVAFMKRHIGGKRLRSQDEAGFTVPELIIMIVVTAILTTFVIQFSLNFWSSSATLGNDSETLVTRLNAGDALRDALNPVSGLINQNSIGDSNAANPDTTAGASYWTLLHAIPGTTTMPATGVTTPLFYYQAPSVNSSKNFIMNGTSSYQDEFVLYLNGTNKQLLLRNLINPAASGDRLKTSCPAALASISCPADRILATDVSSVGLRYFSRSGNTINYTSITDPVTGAYIGPDFTSVEVMEVTINFYVKSTLHGGRDTSNQVIVRVALRNG
jgi:Tfp pilus assembly protein FimT